MSNRKLIRPSLGDVQKKQSANPVSPSDRGGPPMGGGGMSAPRTGPPRGMGDRPGGGHSASGGPSSAPRGGDQMMAGRKRIPPAETNAEIFYYKKQMDSHTPMVIVLQDGEEVEGTIEWYDRTALKINRRGAPNVMLLKHNIKYMYKAEDRDGGGDDEG